MELPKYDQNNPELIESIVCFSDILGFSKMVQESSGSEESAELLRNLHRVLNEQYKFLECINPTGSFKTFTDNIIMAYPKWEDGEGEIGNLMTSFMYFQLNMVLEGYFIRGGISLGEYYGDYNFAYGPALIESHILESKIAINPKIIFSERLIQLVSEHIYEFYGGDFDAPQNSAILYDNEDNLFFLNYLYALEDNFQENHNFEKYLDEIKKHKEQVEQKMDNFKANSKVLSKYSWSAKYHNYFCDTYIKPKLDIEKLEPKMDLKKLKVNKLSSGSFSTLVPSSTNVIIEEENDDFLKLVYKKFDYILEVIKRKIFKKP